MSRFCESVVLLDGEDAWLVLALMRRELDRLKREGVVLNDRTVSVVGALVRAAERHQSISATAEAEAEAVGEVVMIGDVDWIGSAEAGRELGVTPRRVGQLVDAGRLDGRKEGNRLLVSRQSLLAYRVGAA